MHRWPRRLEPQRRIRVASALCRPGPGAPAGGVRGRPAVGALGRKCITEEPDNERRQPRGDRKTLGNSSDSSVLPPSGCAILVARTGCGPRVARWRPAGRFCGARGYIPPACHFRRTDGRQRSVCGARTGSRWATLPRKSGRPRRPVIQDPVMAFAACLPSIRSAAHPRASAEGRCPLG